MENYIPFNCCWASQFEEYQVKTSYGSDFFFGIACILCSFSVNMWTVLCLVFLANKKLWQCVHTAVQVFNWDKIPWMWEFHFRMTCFCPVQNFNWMCNCLLKIISALFRIFAWKTKNILKIIYCSLAWKFIELI